MLATLSILMAILYLKLYDNLNRMVLPLVISDLFHEIPLIATFVWAKQGAQMNSFLCQFTGWMFTFGNTAEGLWSAAIATWFAYLIFTKGNYLPVRVEWSFQLIWVLAAFLASLPILENWIVGDSCPPFTPVANGAWCWIPVDNRWERIVVQYIWIWGIMLYLFIVYISIAVFVRKATVKKARKQELTGYEAQKNPTSGDDEDKKKLDKFGRIMVGFPLIYFTLWIILATAQTYMAATGRDVLPELNWVGLCFVSLNGLCNSIYYGWTKKIWARLKQKCLKRKTKKGFSPKKFQSFY